MALARGMVLARGLARAKGGKRNDNVHGFGATRNFFRVGGVGMLTLCSY